MIKKTSLLVDRTLTINDSVALSVKCSIFNDSFPMIHDPSSNTLIDNYLLNLKTPIDGYEVYKEITKNYSYVEDNSRFLPHIEIDVK
ncbi:hypothetical protein D3C76_1411240 [compost metagenome]